MKNKRLFSFLGAALTICLVSASTVAAEREYVPSARLTHVVEGTFTVKVGDSIDLTNTGVLLTFLGVNDQFGGGYIIRINGTRGNFAVGERFDLKTYTSRLKDRDECWLDFFRVIRAKGAPLTAAFRLDCP